MLSFPPGMGHISDMKPLFAALFFMFLPAITVADCVVFLHGLARTETSFAAMEFQFQRWGYETVSPTYKSTTYSIETLAEPVLRDGFETCTQKPVHFVTHSMGGILLRLAFANGTPQELGRVVMLGPPNQGSELVDVLGQLDLFEYFNGPAGVQLGTGDGSLPKDLPSVKYQVGVIAGKRSLNPVASALLPGQDDGKVSVASTHVAGERDHLVLPVTHTFLMNNPIVIAQTRYFIEQGAFNSDLGFFDAVEEVMEAE